MDKNMAADSCHNTHQEAGRASLNLNRRPYPSYPCKRRERFQRDRRRTESRRRRRRRRAGGTRKSPSRPPPPRRWCRTAMGSVVVTDSTCASSSSSSTGAKTATVSCCSSGRSCRKASGSIPYLGNAQTRVRDARRRLFTTSQRPHSLVSQIHVGSC